MGTWAFTQERLNLIMAVAAPSSAAAAEHLKSDDPCWHEAGRISFQHVDSRPENVKRPYVVWSECPPGENRMDRHGKRAAP